MRLDPHSWTELIYLFIGLMQYLYDIYFRETSLFCSVNSWDYYRSISFSVGSVWYFLRVPLPPASYKWSLLRFFTVVDLWDYEPRHPRKQEKKKNHPLLFDPSLIVSLPNIQRQIGSKSFWNGLLDFPCPISLSVFLMPPSRMSLPPFLIKIVKVV